MENVREVIGSLSVDRKSKNRKNSERDQATSQFPLRARHQRQPPERTISVMDALV